MSGFGFPEFHELLNEILHAAGAPTDDTQVFPVFIRHVFVAKEMFARSVYEGNGVRKFMGNIREKAEFGLVYFFFLSRFHFFEFQFVLHVQAIFLKPENQESA